MIMNSELTNKCKDKEWVLSDFFDTAVHRKLHENDVKKMWAKRVSEQISGRVSAEKLYNLRKKAAQNVAYANKATEEIKYTDIIEELYVLLHMLLDSVNKEVFVEICHSAEIECELKNLYIDTDMINFLTEMKRCGKKIALVSDFYLSKTDIVFIMKKLSIYEIFDAIFVSSEYGVKKNSGNLYKVVKETVGSSAVMIGDNEKADVKMAMANGFDAFYVPYNVVLESDIERELKSIYKKFRKNLFSTYSFSYYLFIEKIYNRLISLNKSRVFFLAREGHFLIKLFNEFQKNKSVKIDAVYLYTSRKATVLSALCGRNEKDFAPIFKSYKDLDIVSFLKNLSFSENEINSIKSELSFDCEKVIYNLKDSDEFNMLLNNKTFCKLIEEKCQEQKSIFKDYIMELGAESDEDIVLVDVGWKGTIQDNIYQSWDGKCKVRGLYFGFENKTDFENGNNIKEGLIFSKYPEFSEYYSIWDFETHLIEQMLAAPHGSTAGYRRTETEIEPVLEQYSDDDRELFENSAIIQDNIFKSFTEINEAFEKSEKSAGGMFKLFTKMHLKAVLLLSKEAIRYEKIALTPGTNNFGWFKKIPTRTSKQAKAKSMLSDLKQIFKTKSGAMNYLNYFAVKMNARRKYSWKLWAYRIIYVCERIKKRF